MKIKLFNKIFFLIFYLILNFITYSPIFAQYYQYAPTYEREKKKERKQDKLIEKIAILLNQNYEELYTHHENGYGYTELIKIILISKKSGQPLKKIIELRDNKMLLSKIAEKFNLDYKSIYKEAIKLKKELDKEIKSENKIEVSSGTVLSNTLNKSSDTYKIEISTENNVQNYIIKSTDTGKTNEEKKQ
jgi:hypothetical protein